ncbi:hypothetical protein B9Z55_025992 [Caenorhabditis nigoni]|uniref:Uncharacterized protein n=1 Tax=Caenorhabditis nigoni TaxID=1611254 RepID=A0A2G5T1A2_9PELO|nr:hypothetical protein B9Z55_025992 [Caenorhabditis nigoni]
MLPRRQKSIANAKPSSQNAHEIREHHRAKTSNRGDLSNSNQEQPHQSRSGIEEDRKDEEEGGKRSEPAATDQPMDDNVRDSTGSPQMSTFQTEIPSNKSK